MKKSIVLVLTLVLVLALALTGCAQETKETKIVIGASPTPHAEILAQAKDILAKENIVLEIKEFTDYVTPNTSLQDKDLDANFFQHVPYLNNFNEENGTDIVSLGAVHYEPLGIYPGKISTLDELKEGSKIGVPNDTTNEARALLLLEANGVIKLKDGVGLLATINDIVENPKNVEIVELSAEVVARSLADLDLGVLNGNNALLAGLSVAKDAVAYELAGSEASQTYANVIAVRNGDEDRPELLKLLEVLQSEEIGKFIEEKYNGSVLPAK